jgi:hypothetical protein
MDVGRDDVGQPAAMTIVLMISSAVRSGGRAAGGHCRRLTSGVEWRCSRLLRIVILASGSAAISAGGRDPDVLGSQADSTDLRRIAG